MTASHARDPLPASTPLRLGLVGSPNAGKTTLFNALTGLRAKVGNYPGVTVERREGSLELEGRPIVAIDLPGTYSLDPISPDEAVVSRVLDGRVPEVPPPDALVVVADACSLERSLLLIGQVLLRRQPTCLVLTMVDELAARGGDLDLERLTAALGIPVVPVVGPPRPGTRPPEAPARRAPRPGASRPFRRRATRSSARTGPNRSTATSSASARNPMRLSERIDRIVLHPVWGLLLFAVVMVAFFQLIFAWATPAMDCIDASIGAAAEAVRATLPPGLLADFLADGVIAGVGSVVIFLPQILLLFGLLYLLEDIGYMARAAFVMDRVMGRIGLKGRSFVALLSSYACAVPGIMATRTIPSPRDRLVTILVAPLMTCSARLPVYTLLIGAFVPARPVLGPIGLQGLALLALYLLGAADRAGRRQRPQAQHRSRARACPSRWSSHRTACRPSSCGSRRCGRAHRPSCAAPARSSSSSRSCSGCCCPFHAWRRPRSSTRSRLHPSPSSTAWRGASAGRSSRRSSPSASTGRSGSDWSRAWRRAR